MDRIVSLVKNQNKFNEEIKLATGLMLDIKRSKHREGQIGVSTCDFGSFWFSSPKGFVLFKKTDKRMFPRSYSIQMLNEVLCYNLANQMGVRCAEYIPATLNSFNNEQKDGLASVSFLESGASVMQAEDFLYPKGNSINSIMEALKKFDSQYNINYNQIYYSLYTMNVFDLLTYQSDRHLGNISFVLDKDNKLKLAPLYDNEFTFFTDEKFYESCPIYHISDIIENYYRGYSSDEYKSTSGVKNFDIEAENIVSMALKDAKCRVILKTMLQNADLRSVYNNLEKNGYMINQYYKEFTVELLDYSRDRIKRIYETKLAQAKNNKEEVER